MFYIIWTLHLISSLNKAIKVEYYCSVQRLQCLRIVLSGSSIVAGKKWGSTLKRNQDLGWSLKKCSFYAPSYQRNKSAGYKQLGKSLHNLRFCTHRFPSPSPWERVRYPLDQAQILTCIRKEMWGEWVSFHWVLRQHPRCTHGALLHFRWSLSLSSQHEGMDTGHVAFSSSLSQINTLYMSCRKIITV